MKRLHGSIGQEENRQKNRRAGTYRRDMYRLFFCRKRRTALLQGAGKLKGGQRRINDEAALDGVADGIDSAALSFQLLCKRVFRHNAKGENHGVRPNELAGLDGRSSIYAPDSVISCSLEFR